MTEWNCEVVKVTNVRKHPNADTLSIGTVLNGYDVIFKTGDFEEGQLASYVPVDSLVPTDREEFAFLADGKKNVSRIRARKLRGVFSLGLLVPHIPGTMEGEPVDKQLGVTKYLPSAEREYAPNHSPFKKERRSETVKFERTTYIVASAVIMLQLILVHNWLANIIATCFAYLAANALVRWNRWANKRPSYPMYDLDSLRRYSDVFVEGEPVYITEKIHGCNSSFCHTGRRFHAKSRTVFREDSKNTPSIGEYVPETDVFWKVAKKYDLKRKLKDHPGIVLYGEVYGKVQDLNYGVPDSEEVRFIAFDAMYLETRKFMDVGDFLEFCRKIDVPTVPCLYHGPWNKSLLELAEGKSVMPGAKHVREGIVVKPMIERRNNLIGRVILKLAGQQYLLRKESNGSE